MAGNEDEIMELRNKLRALREQRKGVQDPIEIEKEINLVLLRLHELGQV